MVCALAFLIIVVVGSALVLTRPHAYQSSSSVALLPSPKKPAILPNYPNIIISLVPTYVQLVSSPVLVNEVAAKLPFHITASQLAPDLHAESLSNAAIINIVAQSSSPDQAKEIAAVATHTFLAHVSGNGVVIPRIYGEPTAPQPTHPSRVLLLAVVVILAAILGAGAGLIWDRFAGLPTSSGGRNGMTGRSPVPDHLLQPDRAAVPSERTAAVRSGAAQPLEQFESVRLQPPRHEPGKADTPGDTGKSGAHSETASPDELP